MQFPPFYRLRISYVDGGRSYMNITSERPITFARECLLPLHARRPIRSVLISYTVTSGVYGTYLTFPASED